MKRRLAERWRWLGLSALTIAILLPGWGMLGPRPVAAQETPPASSPAAADSAGHAAWLQDLAAWRAQREQEIAAPDGWLTLAGLEWLRPGVNAVGAAGENTIQLHSHAPAYLCVFDVSDNSVELKAPDGGFPPDLEIDGEPAQEGQLAVAGAKPSTLTWQSLTLLVLKRGGRYAVRIKDSNARARTAFHGLNWYAPDPHFRVEAHWIPFTPPRIEKIPTVIGTTLDLPSPGVAEFILDGKTIRLEPVIEDPEGKTMFFILRDQTRYDTTYEAARYLHTGLPDHGLDKPGLLRLDFNRLENPPCAYTPYATCPLPPVFNRLLVRLQAGEKRYEH